MFGLDRLTRRKKTYASKKGLPPGTLVFVGEESDIEPQISVFDYDEAHCDEQRMKRIEECRRFREDGSVSWVNVDGIHEVELVREIGVLCSLHPLLLEDVLNTEHRTKLDEFEDHLFIVLKMLRHDPEAGRIEAEQVSMVVGGNYVLSFQESREDVFGAVRERLRKGKGRLRKMGADYLACCLLDAIVDEYLVVLEWIGDRLEALEDEVIFEPSEETVQKIYAHKRDLIFIHKEVRALRAVASSLASGELEEIAEETTLFYKDLLDHILHVAETVDSYRDLLTGMLDTYLTSISNRMNEVMKVLTVIATIFIPITFIAGIYGMNFEHMPELSWPWAYPAALGVMLATAIGMLLYFRKKFWF